MHLDKLISTFEIFFSWWVILRIFYKLNRFWFNRQRTWLRDTEIHQLDGPKWVEKCLTCDDDMSRNTWSLIQRAISGRRCYIAPSFPPIKQSGTRIRPKLLLLYTLHLSSIDILLQHHGLFSIGVCMLDEPGSDKLFGHTRTHAHSFPLLLLLFSKNHPFFNRRVFYSTETHICNPNSQCWNRYQLHYALFQ